MSAIPTPKTDDYYRGLLLGKFDLEVPLKGTQLCTLYDTLVSSGGDFNNAFALICSTVGNEDLVSFLLKDKRVDPCHNDNLCLLLTVINGDAPVLGLLLEDGRTDPNARGLFMSAVKDGRHDCAKLIIENRRFRVEPNIKDLVDYATDEKTVDTVMSAVSLIFDKRHGGVEPDLNDLVLAAMENMNVLLIDRLLESRYISRSMSLKSIKAASDGDYHVTVALMFSYTRLPNYVEASLDFMLRAACKSGSGEIVKFMLEKGAKTWLNNFDSLVFASKHEDIPLMEMLLNSCKDRWSDLRDGKFIDSLEARGGNKTFFLGVVYKLAPPKEKMPLLEEKTEPLNTESVLMEIQPSDAVIPINLLSDRIETIMKQLKWPEEARNYLFLAIGIGFTIADNPLDDTDKFFSMLATKYEIGGATLKYFNVGLGIGLSIGTSK